MMNVNDQKDFNRQNRTWAGGIWFYAVVWLFIFLAGLIYPFSSNITAPFREFFGELFPFSSLWHSSLAGGLGGTLNIFYCLFDVFVRGKREPEYFNVPYYLVQPFIGIIFGVVALLIVTVIFRLFGSSLEVGLFSLELVLIPSMLAGYWQRAILKIINRFVQRFKLFN